MSSIEKHAMPRSKFPRPIAVVLSIAHVYLYRLNSEKQRSGLWKALRRTLEYDSRWSPSDEVKLKDNFGYGPLWEPVVGPLSEEGLGFQSIVSSVQHKWASRFEVGDGIAMNEALTEVRQSSVYDSSSKMA